MDPKVTLSKTREMLIEEYKKALEQDQIPWVKGWSDHSPENLSNGRRYRGCNKLLLSYVAYQRGYSDAGWMTYNQAQDHGWHVKKGEKSTPIEYWSMYDKKRKQNIEPAEAVRRVENGRDKNDFVWRNRTYFVFNASQLAETIYIHKETKEEITQQEFNERSRFKPGLSILYEKVERDIPKKDRTKSDIPRNIFVETLIEKMGVRFEERGSDSYYSPSEDCIVLPPKADFISPYEYYATLLHEAGHASGHPDRLNRDLSGGFGSEKYAQEELYVEIGSSMMMQDLGFPVAPKQMDNHKAYIQSWIKALNNDPNVLFRAITKAELIADYCESVGCMEPLRRAEKYISNIRDKVEIYMDPNFALDEQREKGIRSLFISGMPEITIDKLTDYKLNIYESAIIPAFDYTSDQWNTLAHYYDKVTPSQFEFLCNPSWSEKQMATVFEKMEMGARVSELESFVQTDAFQMVDSPMERAESMMYSHDDLVQ